MQRIFAPASLPAAHWFDVTDELLGAYGARCGHATDLGQEPIRSELEILRERAIQIDLQALERGESISRIGA